MDPFEIFGELWPRSGFTNFLKAICRAQAKTPGSVECKVFLSTAFKVMKLPLPVNLV